MFDENGSVKLIDFGFATVKGKKNLDEVVGTPYYIAPEIINSKPYSCECDMWSLGVVLYQYLTGTMPFDGESIDQCFGAIKKGKFLMPKHLSKECQEVLASMIKVDPKKRMTPREFL